MKNDIRSIEDIRSLVDTFYGKVRNDATIGPIFNQVIEDRSPEHLQHMYRFWQTVLLGEHTYFGSPFPPHAQLPIDRAHVAIWSNLWHETVNELCNGETADEAKWRADKMAAMF